MIVGYSVRLLCGVALIVAAAAVTTATARQRPVIRDHRPGGWQPKPSGPHRPGHPGYNKPGEKPIVRDHRKDAWKPKCGRYSCDRPNRPWGPQH